MARTKFVPPGRRLTAMRPAAPSPFLEVPEAERLCANALAFAIFDSFPVSPGHVLVIPRYAGDIADPRGGVRHVSPEKGNYPVAQEAPGGSRGTPGCLPSPVPCCAGLNLEIACRDPAWMAGWFSCPESPGFHQGLFG